MRALLLDFGGVIHRSELELLPAWATRAGLGGGVGRRSGPFGTDPDELWLAMQRGELTERDYWDQRAAEFGVLFGQDWRSADLLHHIGDAPEDELVRPELYPLLDAAAALGAPVGVLSNDMEHFHGAAWVARQQVLQRFDCVVDASVTGVLKPDPEAYRMAAHELGVHVTDLVFVDDQSWNVEGAAQLGAHAVRVDITNPAPAFDAAASALQPTLNAASDAGPRKGRT